eukprot:g75071.t1
MMITWSACKKLNVVPVLPKARSGALNVANRPRFAFQERQGRSLHGRRLGDLFPTTLTQAQASSHEWQPKQRGNALPASEGESPVSARSPHIIPQPIPDDLSISTPRSLEDGVSSTASLQELLSELSTSSPARPASNAPSAPTATPIATPGASLDASFCRPQELVRKGIDQLAHMLRWLVFGQLEASQGELQFQVYQENRPSTSLTRFGLPLLYRNKSQSARMVSLAEFFHCRDTLDCANLLRHIGALAVHYNPYQSDRVEQLASSLVVSRHHFRHMRYLLWSQDKLMQACEQFFADAHELALLIWATENVLRAVRSHLETLLSLQGTLRTLVALMRSPTDSLPDCVRKLREMRQAVREDRQRVGLVDKSTTSPSPAPVFAAAVLRPRRGLPSTFEQLRICTSLYQGKPLQLAVSGEYFWLNDDSVVRRASYFSVPSFTADQVDLELRGFELLTCCLRRFYLTSKWREPVQQALQRESQKVTAGIEQSSARAVWKQLQDRHNSRYDEASAAQVTGQKRESFVDCIKTGSYLPQYGKGNAILGFETRSTSHAIPARSLGMSRAIATSPRSPFRTTSASQGSPFPCRAGTAEKFPAVRQEFSTTPLHAPFELPRACFPSQNSQSGSSPLARSRSTSPESSAMTTVGTVSSIAD